MTNHNIALAFFAAFAASLVGAAAAQSEPNLDQAVARVERGEPGRPLAADRRATPHALLERYLTSRGKSRPQLKSLRTASTVPGAHGVTHLRMTQQVEGLDVYDAYVRAAVNARGELTQVIDRMAAVSKPRLSRINAQQAVNAALAHLYPAFTFALGAGQADGNVTRFNGGRFFHGQPSATAVVLSLDNGTLARGWLVETWTNETNQLNHTIVSGSGRVLDVELRTQNDSYNVFPRDPAKDPQTLVFGPAVGDTQSPAGWLAGAQTTEAITGNNVRAYLDRNSDDSPDGGGQPAGVDFLAQANLAIAPTDGANGEVSVQNLFYLNNRIHDILHRHGFNEAAGNFQTDNFGRGGRGNDAVLAEGQEINGLDATFATPGEGRAPRMQMYLPDGPGRDILVHVEGGATFDGKRAAFGPGGDPSGFSRVLTTTMPADGCSAIQTDLTDRFALIDRGACNFGVQVSNAQNAGALVVLIANNDAAHPDAFFTMTSSVPTAFIGTMMVSLNAGNALKALGTPTISFTDPPTRPMAVDSGLDSDLVYHEYCHGLTWRMIGRMSGPLAGAIGEGMSDACALLINDDNDIFAEYAASSPFGFRSAPFGNYPRTYGDVGGGPHFDGEIYAAIIWRLIQDFGPVGRETLFGYIVDGMNYTRAKPSYEDMRDGILAAVAASGNIADCARIWDAFAAQGVGVGARGVIRGSRLTITESMTSSTSCN